MFIREVIEEVHEIEEGRGSLRTHIRTTEGREPTAGEALRDAWHPWGYVLRGRLVRGLLRVAIRVAPGEPFRSELRKYV